MKDILMPLAQAALATNAPTVAPAMRALANIGFTAVSNAREQRVLGEMELERAARRYAAQHERIMIVTPSESAALRVRMPLWHR